MSLSCFGRGEFRSEDESRNRALTTPRLGPASDIHASVPTIHEFVNIL